VVDPFRFAANFVSAESGDFSVLELLRDVSLQASETPFACG
jgi:hypothetical protein